MAFINNDLKSPRDLGAHLQAYFAPAPFEKDDVETSIDNARNFNGASPVAANGAWAQQADLIDFIGTCKDY